MILRNRTTKIAVSASGATSSVATAATGGAASWKSGASRGAKVAAGAGILALALTACSSGGDSNDNAKDGSSPDSSKSQATETSFTHPTIDGLTIDFDKAPEKLVMDCYAYSSLDDYGLKPDAVFGYDCDNPWVMGDASLDGIERIGQDGEINMEKLAEIRPDAVIGNGTEEGWSWFDDDVNAQLMRVSTFIPLPNGDSVEENLEGTEDLAEFLGGDTDSEQVKKSKDDWVKAQESFEDAAKEAAANGEDNADGDSQLDVMLTSPTKEMLYTAKGFNQANLLQDLGVTIVGADKPAQGNPWGKVAWEEANTYPADVILVEGYDERDGFSSEIWDSLPAIKDKQVSGWTSKGAMNYRAYADWLQGLADKVKDYKKIV